MDHSSHHCNDKKLTKCHENTSKPTPQLIAHPNNLHVSYCILDIDCDSDTVQVFTGMNTFSSSSISLEIRPTHHV